MTQVRPELWRAICYAGVDDYKRMEERGDEHEDISICLAYQLKRLGPECDRYRQLFFWAMHSLDRAVIERYGFGTTKALPFPIHMGGTQFYSHDGNAIELCYASSSMEDGDGDDDTSEMEKPCTFFSQLVSHRDV